MQSGTMKNTEQRRQTKIYSGNFLQDKSPSPGPPRRTPPLLQTRDCLGSRMLPILPSSNGSFYCTLLFIIYCECEEVGRRDDLPSAQYNHIQTCGKDSPSPKGVSLESGFSNWMGLWVVSPGGGGAYVWEEECPRIIHGPERQTAIQPGLPWAIHGHSPLNLCSFVNLPGQRCKTSHMAWPRSWTCYFHYCGSSVKLQMLTSFPFSIWRWFLLPATEKAKSLPELLPCPT